MLMSVNPGTQFRDKDALRRSASSKQLKDKQFICMADLSPTNRAPDLPPRFQGYLTRKRKRLFNFNAKAYYGSLSAGILKLRRAKEKNIKNTKLRSEYVIELDKVIISYNDKKRYFLLMFRKESHFIHPVDRRQYSAWKDAFQKHRLYRQGQVREGLVNSSELAPNCHEVIKRGLPPPKQQQADRVVDKVAVKQVSKKPQQAQPSQPFISALNQRQSQKLVTANLQTAEDRSDKKIVSDTLTTAENMNNKIRRVLADIKKEHNDIKNLVVSDDDDDDDDDSSTEESIETKQHHFPEKSHKCLEETLFQDPTATDVKVDSTKKDNQQKRPPSSEWGHLDTRSAVTALPLPKPNGTLPENQQQKVVEVVQQRPSAASTGFCMHITHARQLADVTRDVFMAAIEMKQLYDELKHKHGKGEPPLTTSDISLAYLSGGSNGTTTTVAPTRVASADSTTVNQLPATPPQPLVTKAMTQERLPLRHVVSRLREPPSDGSPPTSTVYHKSIATQMQPSLMSAAVPQLLIQDLSMLHATLSMFRPPHARRNALPALQIDLQCIPYSAVLRGRLPIWAYEPLGTLQVLCEELRYATPLLSRALTADSPSLRMCYVAAFVVSSCSMLVTRKQKPFNPMCGETFDYISEDGWHYHAEQVSHHPPISAAFAIHRDWEWHNSAKGEARVTLSGTGELTYKLPVTLILRKYNEVYTWNKVKMVVINPLKSANRRIIRQEGISVIHCSNGIECRLMYENNAENTVNGGVYESKRVVHQLTGNWDRNLSRVAPDNQLESLFEAAPVVREISDRYYGFSPFAVTLNELHADELPYLPPTDSRFRPDERHLELGEPQRATDAKAALEKAQRKREQLVPVFQPVWFEPCGINVLNGDANNNNGRNSSGTGGGEGLWRTNGKYWEARANRFQDTHSTAKMVRDIFRI